MTPTLLCLFSSAYLPPSPPLSVCLDLRLSVCLFLSFTISLCQSLCVCLSLYTPLPVSVSQSLYSPLIFSMQALSVFSLSLPASSRVLLCPSLYPYPLERDGYGQRCQSFCIPLSVCLHRSVYLYLSGPVSFIWLVSTMRFRELFASSSIPESIFSFHFFLIRRRIRRGLGCILQGHSSGEMLGVR